MTQSTYTPFTVEYEAGVTIDDPDNEWTLHLEVPAGTDPDALARKVLATRIEALTGTIIGGDSFAEWCEPHQPEHYAAARYQDGRPYETTQALHVYYFARGRDGAERTGDIIAAEVGVTTYHVTTATVWSEDGRDL